MVSLFIYDTVFSEQCETCEDRTVNARLCVTYKVRCSFSLTFNFCWPLPWGVPQRLWSCWTPSPYWKSWGSGSSAGLYWGLLWVPMCSGTQTSSTCWRPWLRSAPSTANLSCCACTSHRTTRTHKTTSWRWGSGRCLGYPEVAGRDLV